MFYITSKIPTHCETVISGGRTQLTQKTGKNYRRERYYVCPYALIIIRSTRRDWTEKLLQEPFWEFSWSREVLNFALAWHWLCNALTSLFLPNAGYFSLCQQWGTLSLENELDWEKNLQSSDLLEAFLKLTPFIPPSCLMIWNSVSSQFDVAVSVSLSWT